MKKDKNLLAGIAALAVISSAVAGEPPPPEAALPLADPVVGHWCPIKAGVYQRGTWDCKGNLLIKQDEYATEENDCIYSNIKRLPSRDGYTIRTKCMGDIHQKMELRIVNRTLRYNVIAIPTVCGKVGDNMSDGFLNLRSGPGMQYAVTAKLVTYNTVDIGETVNGWTYISMRRPGRNNENEEINGWVGSKYLVRGCSD
jgi:hypothetical protein